MEYICLRHDEVLFCLDDVLCFVSSMRRPRKNMEEDDGGECRCADAATHNINIEFRAIPNDTQDNSFQVEGDCVFLFIHQHI